MEEKLKDMFKKSAEVKEKLVEQKLPEIEKAIEILINALKADKKIFVCGNGGSAADAQHFVGELICTFEKKDRRSLPAIALSTNSSVLTAYANDFGFDDVFKRQLEGLGRKGDVVVGITTSGNSKNIIKVFETAKEKEIKTICLNGKDGGDISKIGLDLNLIMPSNETPRIQEAHITVIHAICKIIDDSF